MTRTVVALYDDFRDASRAVQDLTQSGFSRSNISLVAGDPRGEYGRYLGTTETGAHMETSDVAEGAGVGAGVGAVLGGLGGLLVGLGALTIPGIGPVIAAGPLAAALSGLAGAGVGAVAGGVAGGLLGAMADLGIPEEPASYYAEGVRRGGSLVTVRTPDEMANRAVDILNSHHPVDLNQRVSEWRSSGWAGFDQSADPYIAGVAPAARHDTTMSPETGGMESTDPTTGGEASGRRYDDESLTGHSMREESLQDTGINPGMQEDDYTREQRQRELREFRQDAETAGMRMESEARETMDTMREEGRETMDTMREEGRDNMDTMRESMEETGAGWSDTGTTYHDPSAYSFNAFEAYDDRFRTHFETSMSDTNYTYDQYLPAYRYGYDLAVNERFRDYTDWNSVETDARRYWEERNPGTWERFKNAVQHAWQEVKESVD